jgi:hypothetical protein
MGDGSFQSILGIAESGYDLSVGVPLVGTLNRCGVSTMHYPYKNYLCVSYLNSATPDLEYHHLQTLFPPYEL